MKLQATLDGALGARAMHKLQSYGEKEPTYDNNAYTITSTYHDGTLKIYTTHITPPAGPRQLQEYHDSAEVFCGNVDKESPLLGTAVIGPRKRAISSSWPQMKGQGL
jgi:hypothetical protein